MRFCPLMTCFINYGAMLPFCNMLFGCAGGDEKRGHNVTVTCDVKWNGKAHK